jgi:hypothetical protein
MWKCCILREDGVDVDTMVNLRVQINRDRIRPKMQRWG